MHAFKEETHMTAGTALNVPLKNAADSALTSTLAVTSVGIATLNMLETLLPAAAHEVEREGQLLCHYLLTLADYVNHTNAPQEVRDAIAGAIVAMQFQDRNSQIMDNVTCILERYRSMLEDISHNIEALQEGRIKSTHDMTQAVGEILSSIRLSDIRTRYLEALRKAQVPAGGIAEEHLPPSGDIELF